MKGHGGALGVAFQDANADGLVDVAVANDERPGDLFLNHAGRFEEIGAESGTAYDRQGRVHGGMGIDWTDFDGDGKPDLGVMTFTGEDKSLYRNVDGRFFEDVAWKWGLTGPMRVDIAFGFRFLDYDNDGQPELMVTNGHIQENAREIRAEESYEQPLRLFRNRGATLEPVGEGRWPLLVGRGLATGDLDNDGGTDAVVTNLEGRALLLRNVSPRGHWLGLQMDGRSPQAGGKSNRMGLGARVRLKAGGRAQLRELHTAGSYMSASDGRLILGLGDHETLDELIVLWPSGKQTRAQVEGIDRWMTIHEEKAAP